MIVYYHVESLEDGRMTSPSFFCLEKEKEYIKIDRDKSTFKSHRDFDSEIEITFKHF